MKRTVELDTLEIADKLNELAQDAAMLAFAVEGLDRNYGSNRGADGIIRHACAIHDALVEVSETVCPQQGGNVK